MALVHLLVFLVFCVVCWWVIKWLLNRYVSSKPWHRWIRYAVWVGCIGLLTFDSIYYQVAVVHGMCEADKKRIYPAPPASLVVGGPYTDAEVEDIFRKRNRTYASWQCVKTFTGLMGRCLVDGLTFDEKEIRLPFGGWIKEFVSKNPITNEIYYRRTSYEQEGQWLSKVIFGFGIIWQPQPDSCNNVYSNKTSIIHLD